MPTLQPGSTSQYFDVDIGQTVSVTPGSGGTMLVEYTTNDEAAIRNGSAVWQAWTAGTVASATSDVAMFPMYARATAYTAAGSYEVTGSGLQAVPNQNLAWKSDVVSARDPASAAAVVGAAPMFSAPVELLKVATFGDSTATPSSITGSETTDQRVFNPALGSATTSRFRLQTRDLLFCYYPAARLVAIGGISGQTTTQMLARDALSPSTTRRAMCDLVALDPDIVLLRGGSINDVYTSINATSTDADIEALISRHMQIVDSLVSLGFRVLDEGIYGMNDLDTDTARRQREAVVRLNQSAAAQIAARDSDRVRFLDLTNITHDATGAFLPNISADATHPGVYGCDLIAQAEAAAITAWFGRSGTRTYPGANLLNNSVKSLSLFSETTTSGTNKTPLGFAVASSGGGVAANFDVVFQDGKKWWVGQASTGSAGGAVTLSLPDGFESGATYPIPITANDILGLEFDLLIETLDGSEFDSAVDMYVRFDVRNTGTGRIALDWSRTGLDYVGFGGRIRWHVSIPPIQIDEASAALSSASLIQVVLKPAVGQTLKFGIANVNMTKISV